jgi:hypothetical protein
MPSASSGYASTTGPLTFDPIQFWRTYCITNTSGDVTAIQDTTVETILIGNDWQKHKAAQQVKGTYIGSGFSKTAVRVSIYPLFSYFYPFADIAC